MDLRDFVLQDLTLEISANWIMPLVTTPRSLDLVHIRTAIWFHRRAPLARFVTMDEPQRQAARELGLLV
jgi:hypothetical protein